MNIIKFKIASCARLIYIASLLGLLTAVSVSANDRNSALSVEPDKSPWDVNLITSNKNEFNLSTPGGKVRVLSFFFTHCATMCPVQIAKLSKVQRKLPIDIILKSEFVSISIDPEGDSLERIAEYEQRFQIDTKHWRLTKTKNTSDLNKLMEKLAIDAKFNDEIGELDHRMLIFLINPQGEVVQQYIGNSFDEARLVREITTLTQIHS